MQVGGASLAVIDKGPDFGIQFGAEGLTIPLTPGLERLAKCRLGTYYQRAPGGGRSLFGPGEEVRGVMALDALVACTFSSCSF